MRMLLCITLASTAVSCKTTSSSPATSTQANALFSELICRAPAPEGRYLHVNSVMRIQETDDMVSDIAVHWKLVGSTGAIFAAGSTTANELEANEQVVTLKTDQMKAYLTLAKQPQLTTSAGVGLCTQIWPNSKPGNRSTASCNAVGTAAQGWYVNGKLLKYNRHCKEEVLSCGTSPREGWFVQRKIDRVLISAERCAWQREKPTCKTDGSTSSWYLGERLVARDDDCSHKIIECGQHGKEEGWIAFKRTEPRLYVEGSCANPATLRATAKMTLNK